MLKKNIKVDNKLIVLILLILVSATLVTTVVARYIITLTGSDTARVARFEFNVSEGSTSLGTTDTNLVNIFDTTNLGDNLKDDNLIAPGAKGDFTLVIDNNSEVAVAVTSDVVLLNTGNINLKFYLGSVEPSSDSEYVNSSLDVEAAIENAINGNFAIGATEKTVKVYWKWVDSDVSDTNLGLSGTDTVSLSISVTATQIN